MEEKNNSKYNAEMTINEYLSLLQIKYDCETVYGLAKSLQQDGVTGFGIIPYFTLTAATILEMLSLNEVKNPAASNGASNLQRPKGRGI